MLQFHAIYENGVLRPVDPIELAEGSTVEVMIVGGSNHTAPILDEDLGDQLVGDELAALLDRIEALPFEPQPDDRTDAAVNHDYFLYQKER